MIRTENGSPLELITRFRRGVWLAGCFVGLAMAWVLVTIHFRGQLGLLSTLCGESGQALDCAAVARSPEAKIFGIPNAFLGLAFFAWHALALLVPGRGALARLRVAAWSLPPACLYTVFLGWSMQRMGAWCIFCVAAYVCLWLMLLAAWPLLRPAFDRAVRMLRPVIPHAALIAVAVGLAALAWKHLEGSIIPPLPSVPDFLEGVRASNEHLPAAPFLVEGESFQERSQQLQGLLDGGTLSPENRKKAENLLHNALPVTQSQVLSLGDQGSCSLDVAFDFSPQAAAAWGLVKQARAAFRKPPGTSILLLPPPGASPEDLTNPATQIYLAVREASRQGRLSAALDLLAGEDLPPTEALARLRTLPDLTLPESIPPGPGDLEALQAALAEGPAVLEHNPTRIQLNEQLYTGPLDLTPLLESVQFKACTAFVAPEHQDLPAKGGVLMAQGAPGAVEITMFGDVVCPGCRQAHGALTRLAEDLRGAITIRFRHYPLSSECNPAVAKSTEPGACEGARWVQAAETSDQRGNRLLSSIYAGEEAESITPAQLTAFARQAGLDPEAIQATADQPDVRSAVAEDIALGNSLGITSTPAIFIGGHRLNPDLSRNTPTFELALAAARILNTVPIQSTQPTDSQP
jgi:protein-disulfide isomerase/uncharacterized membrane protein